MREEGRAPWPSLSRKMVIRPKKRIEAVMEFDEDTAASWDMTDPRLRDIGIEGLRRWGFVLASNRRAGIGGLEGRMNSYRVYGAGDDILSDPIMHKFETAMPDYLKVKYSRQGNLVFFHVYLKGTDGDFYSHWHDREGHRVPL